MTPPNSSDLFIKAVSSLNGPSLSLDDIEWATQIQAGKTVIDWFASQAPNTLRDAERIAVAFQGICLEREELELLDEAQARRGCVGASEDVSSNLGRYMRPSEAKTRITRLETETEIIDEEVQRLKSRLKQTKTASKSLMSTIRTLKGEIDSAQSDILQAHDRLSDVSVLADTTLEESRIQLLAVLHSLQEAPDYTEAQLRDISELRTEIIQQVIEGTQALSISAAQLPSNIDVAGEAERLQEAFFGKGHLVAQAEEVYFSRHMEEICAELEGAERRSVVSSVLHRIHEPQPNNEYEGDVLDIVAAAWDEDQAKILDVKYAVIRQTLDAFPQYLLKPLVGIIEQRELLRKLMENANGLASDLKQEIDDIAHSMKHIEHAKDEPHGQQDEQLFESLLEELKAAEVDIREDHEPLILLEKDDVLKILGNLVDCDRSPAQDEEKLYHGVLEYLESTRSSVEPLRNHAYSNSQLNTSPPFSLSLDTVHLIDEAKRTNQYLGESVKQLQNLPTTLSSEDATRKLRSFVRHNICRALNHVITARCVLTTNDFVENPFNSSKRNIVIIAK